MVAYREQVTGLEFNYPKVWQAQPKPDKDCLLKISGLLADSKYGELKITALDNVHDSTVAKTFMESELERALTGYKKVQERRVRFGSRYQYTGSDLVANFRAGEIPLTDRLVFFLDNGRVVCLSFISKTSESGSLQPLFDQMLSSFHRSSKVTQAASGTASSAQTSWSLANYSDKAGQISLGYPQGWKFVNNDIGKDLDVKFTGKNAKGLDAELFVSQVDKHPSMTLDQFSEKFEQTYLTPLKNFRKEASHQSSFGISHNDGTVQYSSFNVEGLPGRQAAAFFGNSKHYYCVALNSVGWTERETRDLFDRVLASIKLGE